MSSIIQKISDDLALGAYLDASATVLGLTVAPDWRPTVLFHLKAIAAAAAVVQGYPLDQAVEPAPVFQA